jgi:hypothetical protein
MAKKSEAPPRKEVADVWHAIKRLEASHEQEMQNLLRMSEVSLILDTYDDIFSDFDPRPYVVRTLSEDFLCEVKRRSMGRVPKHIELTFLIPEKLKDTKQELIIEKRLHTYFQRHYNLIRKEISDIKKRGGLIIMIGMITGGFATAIYPFHTSNFFTILAIVILEPASWFAMWTGLEDIFHTSKQKKPDLEFYEMMSRCKIDFLPY